MPKLFSAKIHDRLRLEFKLRYPDKPQKNGFKTTFWLYLPPSIKTKSQFEIDWYAKRQIHTRLQAPQLSIQTLLDNSASSPLFTLGSLRQLEDTDGFSPKREKLIRHHARLLSCTINRAFFSSIKAIEHAESEEEKEHFLVESTAQIKALSHRWLTLKETFLQSPISKKTIFCLNWTDEAISNQLHLVSQQMLLNTPEDLPSRSNLLKWMRRNKKRISKMSPHFLKASPHYLLRASALKKYTYSALFLKGTTPPQKEWLQHLALGVAAGIAMTWAVFAQIFAFFKLGIDLNQGMNSTLVLYFFLIAVVSYILKDRIKATTGNYLSKRIQQGSSPQETLYHHEERENVAKAIERVFRVDRASIPDSIRHCWESLDPVPMSMWVGGDFVCYERCFLIHNQAAEHTLLNYSGIHDIIRYNVSDWLNSFDDTKRTMIRFSKKGAKQTYEVERLYEIILSVQLQDDTESYLHHYRIHISQEGLQHISKISAPTLQKSPKAEPLLPQDQGSSTTHAGIS